jgi:hypothetical protein
MSQRNKKIKELEAKLPYGSKKEISKRTGLTEKTVGRFFRCQSTRLVIMGKIIAAANEILKEQNELLNSF